jgi:hypothetical protein
MNSNPRAVPTADHAPTAIEPASALRYEPPSATGGWRPEGTAIVAGAAAASLLALAFCGAFLLQNLLPSAFQPRSTFWPSRSVGITLFVLGAVFHLAVVAGVVAALLREAAARPVLIFGGAGTIALSAFYLLVSGLWPRRGVGAADLLYIAADEGARFVSMGMPHALLIFVMTRPSARRMGLAQRWADGDSGAGAGVLPLEAKAIVLAVAIDALCHLSQSALLVCAAAFPGGFRHVGLPDGLRYRFVLLADAAVGATVLCAAAATLRRGHDRPARWLAAGATGWLALRLCGLVAGWWFPPRDFPDLHGGELLVSIAYTLSQTGTMAVIYALTLYVATRPYAKSRLPAP